MQPVHEDIEVSIYEDLLTRARASTEDPQTLYDEVCSRFPEFITLDQRNYITDILLENTL